MQNTKYTYSLQLDITNASWEFRNELNRILTGIHLRLPEIFNFYVIETPNNEQVIEEPEEIVINHEESEQINNNNE